ncbi:hypothetical protein [Acetobacter vaccinii]|uniref:Uncharacterized protein n=1 Tax=Acetobacter vaccinii TaxID=2592655 RepID=A0A5C1YRR1_9PROT|nr:hypothetical protein [Acetobacter vaccinii]QEO17790.1 hypothetical protein FLP30_08660 [Acetobacter vaccinii]
MNAFHKTRQVQSLPQESWREAVRERWRATLLHVWERHGDLPHPSLQSVRKQAMQHALPRRRSVRLDNTTAL